MWRWSHFSNIWGVSSHHHHHHSIILSLKLHAIARSAWYIGSSVLTWGWRLCSKTRVSDVSCNKHRWISWRSCCFWRGCSCCRIHNIAMIFLLFIMRVLRELSWWGYFRLVLVFWLILFWTIWTRLCSVVDVRARNLRIANWKILLIRKCVRVSLELVLIVVLKLDS